MTGACEARLLSGYGEGWCWLLAWIWLTIARKLMLNGWLFLENILQSGDNFY